jgi:hypothetical protein
MSLDCQTGVRSTAMTCRRQARGPGVTARRSPRALCAVRAQSTYGAVTLIVVDAPGEEQFYVMCLDTAIAGRGSYGRGSAPLIEHCFRPEPLAGDRGLPGAQRRCILRPPGIAPHGVLVLFYTSHMTVKDR